MNMIDIGLVLVMVSFSCGYYLGERGLKGVETDLNNLKLDFEGVKAKIAMTPVVTPVVPSAPISVTA